VYRETLKMEFQNLRLYTSRTQKKFSALGRLNPLLMLLAPLAWNAAGKRAFPKMRIFSMALFAWKMFKRVRAMSSFFLKRKERKRRESDEEEQTAAAI